MYDAINKGIKLAIGKFIVILDSDDFCADINVIERVINALFDHNIDACYGNIFYVDKINSMKIIRYWKSSPYAAGKFRAD
jgi:glycosyltransferase involved in cell wall biosynthesis